MSINLATRPKPIKVKASFCILAGAITALFAPVREYSISRRSMTVPILTDATLKVAFSEDDGRLVASASEKIAQVAVSFGR